MADKVALELLIEASESAKTVGELRKSIKDLKDEALAVGHESPEAFNALTKAASEAGERLKHVNENIAAVNPENLGKSFAKLGASIGGAFEVGIGASALFGAESANLEKQLVKIQAVMALTQGISEVGELGKNFGIAMTSAKAFYAQLASGEIKTKAIAVATRVWNAVLNMSPIFILVSVITAVVGAMALLAAKESEETEVLKANIAEREKSIKAMDEGIAKMKEDSEFRLAMMKAEGKSEQEITQQRKRETDARVKELERQNEALVETIHEKERLLHDADEEEKKEIEKQIAELNEKRKANYATIKKDYRDLQLELKTERTKALEEEKKAAEDAEKKRKEAAEAAAKKKREEREAERKFFQDIANEEANEIAKIEQKKVDDFKEITNVKIQFRYLTDEEQKALTAEQLEQYRKGQEEQMKIDQQIADAKLSIQQSTFEGIQSLGQIFINDQKKLEKFNKAAALVQIGIDTARAISSLVAQSQANPANSVTGGVAGVAQFAAGIAQILSNVAKAKQLLGASGSSDAGGGGSTGPRGGNAPQRNDDVARIAEANTGLTKLDTPTVKAVVVETDITSTQKRVNSIEEKASI